MKQKWLSFALIFTVMIGGSFIFSESTVSATSNIQDMQDKVGIDSSESIEESGFFDDADNIVGLILIFAGFWTIISLIFAIMKLQAAANNPEKRTQAIIALVFVGAGAWGIINVYKIAGWFTSVG